MPKKQNRGKQPPDGGKDKPARQDLERKLEEGLEETFPASDPVALTDPVMDVLKNDKISE